MKFDGLTLTYWLVHLFWLACFSLFCLGCWVVINIDFTWPVFGVLVILIYSMAYGTESIQYFRRFYQDTRTIQAMNEALEREDIQAYLKIALANKHLKCVKESARFIEFLLKHNRHE
jgi:hypothetical protein